MRTMPLVHARIALALVFSTLVVELACGQGGVRLDRDGNPLPAGAIARLGTMSLRGCGDPIVYTPGGKYFVATAGPSRSQVVFFDPDSGRRVFEFGTSGTGAHLRFAPDGKRLVCPVPGSYHNPVWDVDTHKQLFKFEGSQAGFSADGGRLITVSFYGKGHCRILDSTSGQLLEERSLEAELSWAEVVPRGSAIVYYDKTAGRAIVYDWARKTRGQTFACEAGFGATASPNGKMLAVAGRQGVRLFELDSGRELANWKQRADGLAVFAPDGRRVAWSGYDEARGIAYPWIAELDNAVPRRVGLPTNNFAPPCFTPDGQTLVVLEDGGTPVWRSVDTGKEFRPRTTHTGQVIEVMPAPDGRHLLSRDGNRWLVWDLSTALLVKRYPDELPTGETLLWHASRAGHILTIEPATGTLRLRDAVTSRRLLKLEGNHGSSGPPVPAMAVARDGKTAALVSTDYQIRVYDLDTGKLRRTHHPKAAVWSLKLSDDGRYLAWTTTSLSGTGPFFLDTHTGKQLNEAPSFRLASGRRWAYVGNADGLERLSQMNLVDQLGNPIDAKWPRTVFDIATSPDHRYLAVYYSEVPRGHKGEGRLAVWDLATGKPLAHVQVLPGTFRFSPDSRLLATTTLEGIVDVWEITTGQNRLSLKGHLRGEIPALAFLPTGRMLVSGGSDGQVMLWDMTSRAPDGKVHNMRHEPGRLTELWSQLAATDAGQAHAAIWELSADPSGTVSFLAQHLEPVARPGAKEVAKLIADLDSPTFATRQRASLELAKWGEAVLPAIQAAAKNPTTLEQARRLQPLRADLERSDLTGERLRGVRAAEVLEIIGTEAARKVLQNLAQGFDGARLTQEANAALRRHAAVSTQP